MNDKRLLTVVVVVCLIILVGVGFYLYYAQTKAPVTSTSQSGNPIPTASQTNTTQSGTGNTSSTGTTPNQAVPTTVATNSNTPTTPKAVTQTFYEWYIHNPQNVVTSGLYKSSPYLTNGFKSTIAGFAQNYNPKYDPVFCNANRTTSYVVTDATYDPSDDTKVRVQITTTDPNNPTPLYDVVLQQVSGSWLIDDTQCD